MHSSTFAYLPKLCVEPDQHQPPCKPFSANTNVMRSLLLTMTIIVLKVV